MQSRGQRHVETRGARLSTEFCKRLLRNSVLQSHLKKPTALAQRIDNIFRLDIQAWRQVFVARGSSLLQY